MAKEKEKSPHVKKEEKPERLFSLEEISKILEIDKAEINRLVQFHKIPFHRIDNKYVRFKMSELVVWVKKHHQPKDKFKFKV